MKVGIGRAQKGIRNTQTDRGELFLGEPPELGKVLDLFTVTLVFVFVGDKLDALMVFAESGTSSSYKNGDEVLRIFSLDWPLTGREGSHVVIVPLVGVTAVEEVGVRPVLNLRG